MARQGLVRQARQGRAWLGEARSGKAGLGRQGMARPGMARLGGARLGLAGKAWYGRLHKPKGGKKMVYKYEWKAGFGKVPADVAGKHIEKLQKEKGEVTKETLLDSARPEDSAIHPLYEWDDSVAAEKYRLSQSGHILRNLVRVAVVDTGVEKEQKTVRAFIDVSEHDKTEKGRYIDIYTALSNENTRAIVLRKALDELVAFKNKYETLNEFANVFDAINEVEKVLAETLNK